MSSDFNMSQMNSRVSEKLEILENLIFLLGEQNYRNGFPYYNTNYKKRRKLFNPLFANTFIILILIRDFISFFITEDYYSLLIGDYVFKFDFKLLWNLMVSEFCLMVFIIQIDSYLINKNNKTFTKIMAKNLNSKDSRVKKIKLYINLIDKPFNYFIFTIAFIFSFGFLSLNSSTIYLFTIGIFWSIILGLQGVIAGRIY